jgi:hypothetical protein
VCINTFLDTELRDRKVWLELRARHTIQKRGLFDNLRLATVGSWGELDRWNFRWGGI